MRCAHCQQTVRPGMELVKRVEFRGGVAYGENMPGGSLVKGAATELPIEKILHQKCYWVTWKRENRGGDANLGTRPGLIDPYEDEDYD
jgi:hypothetical protein